MKHVTAVAVSGGIDSLVAASLVKEMGDDVIGIHFKTGFETFDPNSESSENNVSNIARHISSQLDIPVKIMDLSGPFRTKVVDYFIKSYMAGVTPNPCLVCNPAIKFGALLESAKEQGASRFSTGHYAGTETDNTGTIRLKKGKDQEKDQSYFLAFLTRRHLSFTYFPLWNLTKNEVRSIAKEKGLAPVSNKESQDVCFIRHMSYAGFLERQGISTRPGLIIDTEGNILGQHNGLHFFTVGQRRGINCPAKEPYYVLRINTEDNSLTVGFKNELYRKECRVKDINWICDKPSSPLKMLTRIRYSHKGVLAQVIPTKNQSAIVIFDSEQPAVTPGQGAVFYKGDEVAGGGWIV
ncbi:MAG: tRNA 2-thiouridine(34) synthase MnmA [Deltaproteobacteria bacterium]|nr:tRNA 2-thiouridine(34) synthase MnmA [Deltaproteobacteria bacterium]